MTSARNALLAANGRALAAVLRPSAGVILPCRRDDDLSYFLRMVEARVVQRGRHGVARPELARAGACRNLIRHEIKLVGRGDGYLGSSRLLCRQGRPVRVLRIVVRPGDHVAGHDFERGRHELRAFRSRIDVDQLWKSHRSPLIQKHCRSVMLPGPSGSRGHLSFRLSGLTPVGLEGRATGTLRGPEVPEAREPGVERGKAGRVERIDAALRVAPDLNQSGLAQQLEMLRYRGRRHVEAPGDLANRQLARGEHLDDALPGRVAERRESLHFDYLKVFS